MSISSVGRSYRVPPVEPIRPVRPIGENRDADSEQTRMIGEEALKRTRNGGHQVGAGAGPLFLGEPEEQPTGPEETSAQPRPSGHPLTWADVILIAAVILGVVLVFLR